MRPESNQSIGHAEAWQTLRRALESELPAQQYATWIRPLVSEPGSPGLVLFAPNRFIRDWVEEKYLARVNELMSTMPLDGLVSIEVAVVPQSSGRAAGPSHSEATDKVVYPMQSAAAIPTTQAGGVNQATQQLPPHSPPHSPPQSPPPSPPQPDLWADAGSVSEEEETVAAISMAGQPAQEIIAPDRWSGTQKRLNVEGGLKHEHGLLSNLNFDSFVEGKSNQLARAAATQVADNPGAAYNPLLIYGGTGLGKTHLMHSVGNALLAENSNAKIVYLHSERFVADMVKALQLNAINDFKRFYRSVDALLIDDIQFFANKDRSQEEFFHTFNALLEGGQQMILSCDRFPKEINGLEERLKSRFGWGLTVAIEPPELETRAAILMKKAENSSVELSNDIALFIAQRVRSNVRDLEGALKRLIASATFHGRRIDEELVRETLKDLIAMHDRKVSLDNIQRTVAEYYKIKVSDLMSKRRSRSVARPRQMAMTLSKELTNHSLPEIGNSFGGKDHTTVLHACRKIKELRDVNTDIAEDYTNLLRSLTS